MTDIVESLRKRMLGKQLGDDPLAKVLGEAADELEVLNRTFDLMWTANQRGIKLWRAAHPDKQMILPDQSRMIDWLVDEIERLREIERLHTVSQGQWMQAEIALRDAEIERLRAEAKTLRNKVASLKGFIEDEENA